jgi:AAA-like domain/Anaphase-promoting complex, cyclosome, subunit 3
MEKVLKKYTIIPQHLYVNRSADSELKRIIEEMQRPGYVLVARQMGKTNLLFHAKRTLENENRLFVYVDLSNLFENERDCYRNIINNIVEPNSELFEPIETDIENIRENNLTPHNEYSRCLRVVLKVFQGNIVIILDEIDALKSVDYSDNIFAQIRSNYFSRTNFPEFERLTYVLSGVIEPTELIKDRNKSPFNIGDKIYLDDFTKKEHNNFIQMSRLEITQGVSDEVFNWTNGNPRLTFDICSELENYILSGEKVDNDLLEKIVKKNYLTTFDTAPIDHIRELVKTNEQVRNSISLINKKQSFKLSDERKRKLYLYGIIDSKFDEETKIKNIVIEKCLSEEWIKSIDKDQEVNLLKGLIEYDKKEYTNAVEIFLDVLGTSESSESDIQTANYFLGLSYYRQHDFKLAMEYFAKEYLDEKTIVDAKLYLGVCKLAMGAKDEGIALLEEWTKQETNTAAYFNALLNLAINLSDKERATNILIRLNESTYKKTKDLKEDDLVQYRTISLYYQAEILLSDSKSDEALNKIDEALEVSDVSLSPYLIFLKYGLSPANHKDEFLKSRLVNEIVNNQLDFDKRKSYPISFSENLFYVYLDFVFDQSNLEFFERLLDYASTKLLSNLTVSEIIYNSFLVSDDNKIELLEYLIRIKDSIKEELLIDIYWNLAYYEPDTKNKYFEAFDKYLTYFTNSNRINSKDIYLFTITIGRYANKDDFHNAINLCKVIEPRFSLIEDENVKIEFSIIYYWYAITYFSIKDRFNAKKYADLALELLSKSNKKSPSWISEKGLFSISDQLRQIKYSTTFHQPIVNNKKYGKNEKVKVKYLDGREAVKKYKVVEADIIAERCRIIG